MIPILLTQVLPTPTGGTPITTQLTSPFNGNFQHDLNAVLADMRSKGETQLASAFRTYALQTHSQHPELGMQQIIQAFLDSELAGAVATGIGQTGTILGQLPGAAAKGAENAFHGLDLGSWFLRIGEILLGLVLVGVGVARITGVQNAISKVVKAKVPL